MGNTAFQPEEYDKKIQQTLPYYEEFYQQIVDILAVMGKKDIAWLDIGCGTGKMYEAAKQIALRRWQNYQIAGGKNFSEASGHIKRYGTEYYPITLNAHFELMRKCGFWPVELIWMSYMQAGFMGIKNGRNSDKGSIAG